MFMIRSLLSKLFESLLIKMKNNVREMVVHCSYHASKLLLDNFELFIWNKVYDKNHVKVAPNDYSFMPIKCFVSLIFYGRHELIMFLMIF